MHITDLKRQAITSLLNGKYECARDIFADIHKQNPSDLRVFVKLAEMKEKTNDFEGAISDFIEIASIYARDGAVEQAIATNKVALRIDPNREDIQQKLQNLSSERGEIGSASTIADRVLDAFEARDSKSPNERFKAGFTDTPLFTSLSDEEVDVFLEALTLKEFSAGEFIFKEGTSGESLYLIGMGTVSLQIKLKNGKTRVFLHLQEGGFFGEYAFISHLKHSTSAVAETKTSLLMLDRTTFDTWVNKYPKIMNTMEEFYKQRVLAKVLAVTPLFKGIKDDVCLELAKKFTLSHFNKGSNIMCQGEQGNSLYIIRSGRVQISAKKKDDSDNNIGLEQMGEGAFFGEVSLITGLPRTATVTACQEVELMELTHEDFNVISKRFPSVRRIVDTYRKKRAQNTIKSLTE